MYCPDCKIEVESGEYCPLCGRKLVRDSHSTGTVVDDSFSGEAAQVSGKKRCNLVITASFSTLIAFGKGTNSSSVYTKPLNFTNFIELMNF